MTHRTAIFPGTARVRELPLVGPIVRAEHVRVAKRQRAASDLPDRDTAMALAGQALRETQERWRT